MVVLFDFDSLIYSSAWKVVSFTEIKDWLKQGKSRTWIEEEIVHRTVNRSDQAAYQILEEIENHIDGEITDIKYYITTCRNNFRYKIDSQYKASRSTRINPLRKWVKKVRTYLTDNMDFAICSDIYEADDLIIDEAKKHTGKFIIVSIDKDLQQIPGLFFDYKKVVTKDKNGLPVVNKFGDVERTYKGFKRISAHQAELNLWSQVLKGDPTDNVKGLKGIGDKRAAKILKDLHPSQYRERVFQEYRKRGRDDMHDTYHLVLCGSRDLDFIYNKKY